MSRPSLRNASLRRILFQTIACSSLSSLAAAQWTYEVLHPAGVTISRASGGRATAQGGTVEVTPGVLHAGVWFGSAASFADLHDSNFSGSTVTDCDGISQAGWVDSGVGGQARASMWGGSPGSRIDLHPPGATDSFLFSVDGSLQGGCAVINGIQVPGLWAGSASSFVDLTPPGYLGTGFVHDISMAGGQQVGYATQNGAYRAGMWTGSGASWVEFAVGGIAFGTDGAQQVGHAPLNGGAKHACLWTGTAASVVDLAPANSGESAAYAVDGGEQVGYVSFPFIANRAFIWSGTAASAVDLHAALPAMYTGSTATAIWHANGTTYVLGTATTTTYPVTHAILWRRLPATTYCTGKQNSAGCTPSIGFAGSPSATNPNGFYVKAINARNQQPGLLLYSAAGRNATSFAGGTLCIGAPISRGPVLDSFGSNPPTVNCTGVYSMDMHAFRDGFLGGSPRPFLSLPGTVVNCQFWGRDPGFPAPNNVQLSNGLEYEIGI